MKNLSRWEIANHLHTSVKEIHPFERDAPAGSLRGAKGSSGGEFYARIHTSPDGHLREERSFTQSLWGRR